jgi:hypothetical protein
VSGGGIWYVAVVEVERFLFIVVWQLEVFWSSVLLEFRFSSTDSPMLSDLLLGSIGVDLGFGLAIVEFSPVLLVVKVLSWGFELPLVYWSIS